MFLLYTDVNECSTYDANQCSQICVNTEGSYICQCSSGYRLSADERSCDGKEMVYLVMSTDLSYFGQLQPL